MSAVSPSTGRAIRDAYNAAGSSWGDGPVRLYGRLAEVMLDHSPVPMDDRTMLDVGAGSGAVSEKLLARRARPVPVDFAIGMLLADRSAGLPATNGDVTRLPFRSHAFGGAAAGFCLNHLPDPALGLRELGRVVAPGGVVLVSTFGHQVPHPAKAMVDEVARRHGFEAPGWYREMKESIEPLLGSIQAMRAAAGEAGMNDAAVTSETVDAGIDDPETMAAYRLGMAHLSPFVARLSPDERRRLRAEAEAALNGLPPIRPRVVILAATITG